MGDDYFKSIGESIKYANHITDINFSKNRLTNKGLDPVLRSIKNNIGMFNQLESLNLSFNKLNGDAIKNLCRFLTDKSCDLKKLNLEGNNLGDQVVSELCDNIFSNIHLYHKIQFLNLGQNNISDYGASKIVSVLEVCDNLRVLILYWNKISNLGAALIVREMKNCRQLRIFDISWNNIGSCLIRKPTMDDIIKHGAKSKFPKRYMNVWTEEFKNLKQMNFKKPVTIGKTEVSEFAKELSEYFSQKDIYLVHLDISHNNIDIIDSELISIDKLLNINY